MINFRTVHVVSCESIEKEVKKVFGVDIDIRDFISDMVYSNDCAIDFSWIYDGAYDDVLYNSIFALEHQEMFDEDPDKLFNLALDTISPEEVANWDTAESYMIWKVLKDNGIDYENVYLDVSW